MCANVGVRRLVVGEHAWVIVTRVVEMLVGRPVGWVCGEGGGDKERGSVAGELFAAFRGRPRFSARNGRMRKKRIKKGPWRAQAAPGAPC